MTTDHDERRGLPSASSMQRLIECAASHAMQAALPREEGSSEDAASGTRIHAVLAGEADESTLSPAELETMDMCASALDEVFNAWNPGGVVHRHLEKRLGLTELGTCVDVTKDTKASIIFTGQADVVFVCGDSALVCDYKTGRAESVEAVENAQVAALAVLVHLRHKVSTVRVAIIAPWCGKPTTADYSINALTLARGWLLETLRNVEEATPEDLKAGEWCKYCRAQFGCPAFKLAALNQIEKIDPMSIAGMDGKQQRAAMFARAMEMTPEQHIAAWKGLSIVSRYQDAIASSFKQRVEAGQIPGFSIVSRPGNREITDPEKAFNALIPLGVTTEDVLAACTIPVGAMEEAVRIRSGVKSKTEKRITYNLTTQQAKDALNAALEAAGAIGRKAEKQEIVETTNRIEE